jgi:hypothetical protein
MDPLFGDVPPPAGIKSPLGHTDRGNFPQNKHRFNTPGRLLAARLPRPLSAGRRP